jgi:hypothetical protein
VRDFLAQQAATSSAMRPRAIGAASSPTIWAAASSGGVDVELG